MQFRTRIFAVMLAGLSVPALAADANPPGPQGGPGASPDQRPPLSEAQRKALEGMTPEQRQQYFERMRQENQARRQDRDNNPPGPAGGPGTNWENPPGPQGGPGASPGQRSPLSEAQRKALQEMMPEQRQQYFERMRQEHQARRQDRDNNPPGPAGSPGANRENRPGSQGNAGARAESRSRLSE